jgi:hypothetical protein
VGDPTARASEEAARASDIKQAAYFREVLSLEQAQLAGTVSGMRRNLESHRDAGDRIEANRLQIVLLDLERELTEVTSLLTRLDQRFAPDISAD